MMHAHEQPTLLVLMGPTASGKSRLALNLARALDGEVVSVDSAQVYRGMDIGTAKPSATERKAIPHHLIDLLEPTEPYSAGQFVTDAHAAIARILARGRQPILAGGTFLYFRALMHGLSALPPANPKIREALGEAALKRGWPALHQDLEKIDPEAAARIHPNDPQRIQRALELFELTGIPMSTLQRNVPPRQSPYRWTPCLLAPEDRSRHRHLIADRFMAMLNQGLVEEVEGLRQRGDLNPDLPSMRSVGYRQIWSYLEGNLSESEMIEGAITATRQFAKRQLTWLRQENFVHAWSSEDPSLDERVIRDLGQRSC